MLEEEVDDVEETAEVAVLVVVPNGNKRRRNVGRNTNGVLDIQRLISQAGKMTVNVKLTLVTYSFYSPLRVRVGDTAVDADGIKRPGSSIRTENGQEFLMKGKASARLNIMPNERRSLRRDRSC